MSPKFVLIIIVSFLPAVCYGEIVTKAIDYQQGGQALEGWLAYDDSVKEPRPGILVFPEWWGLTDYPKHRAEQLAKLGYVAFAADMYGKGITTDDPNQAGQLAGKVKGDIDLLRARANAALDQLKSAPGVDPKQIAAIGYCFGGTVALELARSGADLAGVVSFHGGLDTPRPDDAKNIKGKILVCSGGDDAFVSPQQIAVFEDEMRKGNVDWQVIVYGGAHHAFTNPDADRHHIPNIGYNAAADHRSWAAMQDFFDEIFPNGNKRAEILNQK
jgi:dienelactone hydrolase